MNVSVTPMSNVPNGVPACFGKEWSNTEPECTGGPDHSFKDEEGKHVRPRCGSFNLCGTVTATGRQPLITPQTLIRPQHSMQLPQAPVMQPPAFAPQPAGMPPRPMWTPPVTHPPVSPPSVLPDWQRIEQQRVAGLAKAQAAQAPQFHAPYAGPQFGMPAQAHYPAQTWQVGNAMPAYLTHEEVRQPGESYVVALFFSLLRGMGKAAGHTFARYVDVTPFREPPRS